MTYCSRQCQKANFEKHFKPCKNIAYGTKDGYRLESKYVDILEIALLHDNYKAMEMAVNDIIRHDVPGEMAEEGHMDANMICFFIELGIHQ